MTALTLVPGGEADNLPALQARAHDLASAGRATLALPDGVYGIASTLHLPQGVSLDLAPGATLLALPGFDGEAVVRIADLEDRQWQPQTIRGGMIDGGAQSVTGILTGRDRETDIINLTIRNCLRKGVHIGTEFGCEVNLTAIRCQVERGVIANPGSVGIHYDKCTDSLVTQGTVIGYETGVRSDSSSNDFQQIHAWNYDANAPLRTCFFCGGWNDSWNQCYADSPMNDGDEGIGFHVTRPFNRITNCRVYNNQWVTPGTVTGIFIGTGGTHGTYIGNHFTARQGHEMKAAFAGTLEAATIIGNTFDARILGGIVAQIPSGGGLSPLPPVVIGQE